MGHDSEATTHIYLSSLDTEVVDKANRKVISALEDKEKIKHGANVEFKSQSLL